MPCSLLSNGPGAYRLPPNQHLSLTRVHRLRVTYHLGLVYIVQQVGSAGNDAANGTAWALHGDHIRGEVISEDLDEHICRRLSVVGLFSYLDCLGLDPLIRL